MKIISHRANLSGPETASNGENNSRSIINCIELGLEVEVDVWLIENRFFLGHDSPDELVSLEFLLKYKDYLWIHCKNSACLSSLIKMENINCFWHQNDDMTITSNGSIWVYPGKQPVSQSIAVMPEIFSEVFKDCEGICTDFPLKYVNL